MKIKKRIITSVLVTTIALVILTPTINASLEPNQTGTYTELANENYQSGSQAYDILNSDDPETISASDYHENKMD